MCKAKSYLKRMNDLCDEINNDLNDFRTNLSRVDKQISKLYHEIETSRFNASQGYHFSKKMQQLLQERRRIKHEKQQLAVLKDKLHKSGFQPILHKANKIIVKQEKRYENYSENFDTKNTNELVMVN